MDGQSPEHAEATILVVDDEPANLGALNALLRPCFRVRVARSGAEALCIVDTAPRPDLVLLDVMMPGMDGYTVLARLRESPASRDLPVIFVTAMDSSESEERGLDLGAVDYITKPINPAIVLARVRTQLELKRGRDALRAQNADLEAEVARRLKENQQVQMQLLQREKLAAIGLLAAGMAHEINNPLCFVIANLGCLDSYMDDLFALLEGDESPAGAGTAEEVALAKMRKSERQTAASALRGEIAQLVSESKQGLARVSRIVSDLKNFSRAEGNDWLWADLHSGLDATLNIVWNEIKYHCTLHKEYGDLPEMYCFPSQINQVLLNLLVNAAQAIPEKGEITIRTGQAAGEAFIAITDTGSGIPAENLPRLFEPFFTTKPVGQGTGLGLSISYGIVHKHGGRIAVDSTVGKGTTFTVWLPVRTRAEVAAGTER